MDKKKVIKAIVIGVIASLIGASIVAIVSYYFKEPQTYDVQIISQAQGKSLSIDSKVLQETTNQDNILFIFATGSSKEYDGMLTVEVNPIDVKNWFGQEDVTPVNGTFTARIQLGSREWPIRGGEEYRLRVSSLDEEAEAIISVERQKKQYP